MGSCGLSNPTIQNFSHFANFPHKHLPGKRLTAELLKSLGTLFKLRTINTDSKLVYIRCLHVFTFLKKTFSGQSNRIVFYILLFYLSKYAGILYPREKTEDCNGFIVSAGKTIALKESHVIITK